MTGFSDRFRHWLPPSEEDVVAAVTQGMVVLDTNVLLDMYRFGVRARNELFEAFDKLGDRLWIPHQVAHEFHKNRIQVLMKHGAAYSDLLKAMSETRDQVSSTLTNKIRHFSNRIALDDKEAGEIAALVVGGLDQAISRITDLHKQHGLSPNPRHDDPILARLDGILSGKLGPGPSEEEDSADRAEAARRITHKIPPGHEDHRKEDPHGDYLLWRQCLREVSQRKVPLVIVTRDSKEDWFWRESGQRIGARWELVKECAADAAVPFVLMTTDTFLHHAAKTLKATVSDDTIRQAVDLTDADIKTNALAEVVKYGKLLKEAAYKRDQAQEEFHHLSREANELHAARNELTHRLLQVEGTETHDLSRHIKDVDNRLRISQTREHEAASYLRMADETLAQITERYQAASRRASAASPPTLNQPESNSKYPWANLPPWPTFDYEPKKLAASPHHTDEVQGE